jgi:hypothetical protein
MHTCVTQDGNTGVSIAARLRHLQVVLKDCLIVRKEGCSGSIELLTTPVQTVFKLTMRDVLGNGH